LESNSDGVGLLGSVERCFELFGGNVAEGAVEALCVERLAAALVSPVGTGPTVVPHRGAGWDDTLKSRVAWATEYCARPARQTRRAAP